jgi:colanic acid/amylovoran biosynthesis glycosyltransferase
MNIPINPTMRRKQTSKPHPPRLVLFVRVFPRRSETFIVDKFLGLLKRGWDIHIVCNRCAAEDRHLFPQLPAWEELRQRVHVTSPGRAKFVEAILLPFLLIRSLLLAPKHTLQYLRRGWRRFGPYILRLFSLDAEFIVLHPAIVHYEFSTLADGHMYQKDLLDCRISVSFRGTDINTARLDKPDFYLQIWEHADALHFISENVWKEAKLRGCPSDKPHTLIFPAIDTSFFTPTTIKKEESVGIPIRPFRILSVGRLDWVKGYEYALQAIKWLVEHGISCEYRIIGEGAYSDAVRFTIRDLGLEKIVTLLGPGSRSDVKEQLNWTDVFILASISEGFSNSVLEAQAMKIPVVCSDAGGLAENVINDETGFVVQSRDWQSMGDRLVILAASQNLRTLMGDAGRKRILDRFQIDDEIENFDQFYRQALT